MGFLLLVRHGMSIYNQQDLWTGWDDPSLSPDGQKQAEKAALEIKNIRLDKGYTSVLKRAIETLDIIKQTLNRKDLPVIKNAALNERNYGVYTGRNKWEIKKEIGDDEFLKLRRSWNYPIPQGESLKQVYERVIPYYQTNIIPDVISGKNVIVSSSGNALRALVKYLENISDDDISGFEIETGEVLTYSVDNNGQSTREKTKS